MGRRRYRDPLGYLTSPKSMYAFISIMLFLMVLKVVLQVIERYYAELILLLTFAIVGYYFYRRQQVVRRLALAKLSALTDRQFEFYWGDFFTFKGYKTQMTPQSGDQGADVIVEKDGIRTAIQAKKYSGSVGNSAIQEVVASKAYYNCQQAMVITTGYFTPAAKELASVNAVELWDRDRVGLEVSRLTVQIEQQAI